MHHQPNVPLRLVEGVQHAGNPKGRAGVPGLEGIQLGDKVVGGQGSFRRPDGMPGAEGQGQGGTPFPPL